jgi:hypothetical protein
VEERIRQLISRLAEHNIPAVWVKDKKEAFDTVNYTFLNPWKPGITAEESLRLKKRALTSDVFITGTNAITLDGKIVNVDAHGNRVAAILFGPDRVVVVVGINKIVEDVDEALERIKSEVAPLNVKRHSEFDPAPPCAETGTCSDCSSPWRICNKTVIIERQFNNDRYKPVITVVIVGERLGL